MAVRKIFKYFEKMILTRNPNSSGMAETSNAVIAGNGREGLRIDIEFKVINQFFQICCFSSVQFNRFLVLILTSKAYIVGCREASQLRGN